MLCTYLYNTQAKQLEVLEPQELLSRAPDEAQVEAKRASLVEKKHKGAAVRGRPRCNTGEFMWVDACNPTPRDFLTLKERFGLHPMVLEDIRSKEGRPKLHSYGDYLYIIFFAVQWKERSPLERARGNEHEKFSMSVVEIDCLVGPDFVVTIHDEPLSPLDDLRDRWMRRPEMMKAGTGYLLYEMMDEVLDDYFPLLDALDEHVSDFEEKLFDSEKNGGDNRPISADIFAMRRDLLQIRRIAGPTRDVVNLLLRHDSDTGGRNFVYFQDLYDHASRIVDMVDNFREILAGALDAYLATESNRMNVVMKTLTACSIILFVPNLLAAIYGMNFENMPELKSPTGYYFVLAIMANSMALMFAYFKRLKWL
jgi:magnesium transporter